MQTRVEIRGRLGDEEVASVLSVVEAATEADGVRPLNEHVLLHLRYGDGEPARDVLLYADDALAGYAYVETAAEGPSGELVVHPAFRRRGLGRALVDAAVGEAGGRLAVWAHGDHPAARRLAASTGFTRVRSLWRMRRSLSAPLASPVLPEGVRISAFTPGQDEQPWIAVNARAFAHHPEQGAWTIEDLKLREREPWFDPAGFFLAHRGDRLVGFHWTKIHPNALGEVYVVGVDPSEQGTGLGRALTLIGLAHLRSKGLPQAMLYVDEANTAAIRLYESLGFSHWDTDVMYRR
jgi:mycothiol synthase